MMEDPLSILLFSELSPHISSPFFLWDLLIFQSSLNIRDISLCGVCQEQVLQWFYLLTYTENILNFYVVTLINLFLIISGV